MSTTIQNGDTVRITVEGIWGTEDHPAYSITEGEVSPGRLGGVLFRDDDVVTIELVKAATEQFQPGDVVRQKGKFDTAHVALGNAGFLNLESGDYYRYGQEDPNVYPDGHYYRLKDFHSGNFELV